MLDAREKEIAAREEALAEMLRQEVASRYLGLIALLVVSVLLLLGLIGLNFYLDAKRTKERETRAAREGELLIRL
jgi:cytoskeletal protein RodZ